MFIRQTLIIESFCDHCSAGMLQPLLDAKFMQRKSAFEMKDEKIVCPKCQHENTVKDVFMCIPNEFLWFGDSDLEKYKKDESVKNFLKD